MNIESPYNFSLDNLNDKFFWKYLDLFKLFDLIQSKQLHFTRFDHFEDGLEGISAKGIFYKALTHDGPYTMGSLNPLIEDEQKKIIIETDEKMRKEYLEKLDVSQKTQYASCWFTGDKESMAMWKIYSTNEGVAIKINARQLTDTVIASAQSYTNNDFKILYYGPVEYKNLWPFDPDETYTGKFNGLKKDKSYSYEQEFRFVAVVPSDKKGVYPYLKIPIGPLSTFDMEIIANPFMDEWKYSCLKSLLCKFNLENKLKKSKIVLKK